MRSKTRQQIYALLHALCVGASIGILFTSTPVFAQDETLDETLDEPIDEPVDEPVDEAVELQRFSVTGSRIKRVDTEGALPVTVINREMIELSGETSLSDLLRNLSFNSFGSYSSSYQGDSGTTQISLRGLGAGRSLILIDGRRLPKAPISTSLQNLNTIPLGSVERIEILSDGASAIYGSDAIGGVINIITRDDYSGWELMYGRAEPHWGKGKRDQGHIMFGRATDKSNLIATFSFNDKDISYDRDFPDYEPGGSIMSNNVLPTDPEYGFPDWDLFGALPGGCTDSDAFYLVPDPWSVNGEYCAYDWRRLAAAETSVDTRGVMVKYEYELASQWSLWTNVSASETNSFGLFSPLAYSSLFDDEPMPADSPNNPTNPASPIYDPAFGPNVPVHWLHRFESLGTRNQYSDTTLIDAQAGVNGWLGSVELEFGLRRSWNSTEQLVQNLPLFDKMYPLIADGSYDLQHPASTAADVLEAMKTDYTWNWDFDQDELFADASWDLFNTAAGPVQWVVGGEYRQERYRADSDWPDDDPVAADRNTTSLFFETLVPVTRNLELSLAGRYDSYSDWGSEFSPKVSLRWRVSDKFVARASWGEGFRAPQLSINTIVPQGFPNWTDEDPRSCVAIGREPGCTIVYQSYWTVSEALSAETSEQYSLGLVWDPVDWLNMTIDYYNITIEDEIGGFGDGEILELDKLGLPPPPGLGVVRDPSGLLLRITSGWGNYGLVETSGMDLNTSLSFDLGPGRWQSNLLASWVFDYSYQVLSEQSPNVVGFPGYPQARGTLSNYYDIENFTFAWNIHYIADQLGTWEGDYEDWEFDDRVPTWVTHDVQVNYKAPWNGRITVGAQNVFNEEPPLHVGITGSSRNYDFWLYDFYGRVLYVEYTQSF
jgi:iron complex outermembrane receptor protein